MIQFCFDCDDTLYDMREPFDRARDTILPDLEADPESFYKDCRQFSEEIFGKVQDGTLTVDQSGAYRIYRACEAWGQPISQKTAEAFQSAYKEAQKNIQMSPVLSDWMKRTKAGLWVLTNGPDEHQRKKLKSLGAERYIPDSHIYTSGKIGFAKPDSRAFEAVTASPSDFWYIGDNYINDMEGAKAAGWRTIHLDRRSTGSGPAADFVVHDEKELVSLLNQLERKTYV